MTKPLGAVDNQGTDLEGFLPTPKTIIHTLLWMPEDLFLQSEKDLMK